MPAQLCFIQFILRLKLKSNKLEVKPAESVSSSFQRVVFLPGPGLWSDKQKQLKYF